MAEVNSAHHDAPAYGLLNLYYSVLRTSYPTEVNPVLTVIAPYFFPWCSIACRLYYTGLSNAKVRANSFRGVIYPNARIECDLMALASRATAL